VKAWCDAYDVTDETALQAEQAEQLLLSALLEAGPLPSLKSFSADIAGGIVSLAFLPNSLESLTISAFRAEAPGTWRNSTPGSIAAALSELSGLRSLSLLRMPELQRCLPEPAVMASCWRQLTSVTLRASDRITPALVEQLQHLPQSLKELRVEHEPEDFFTHFEYMVRCLPGTLQGAVVQFSNAYAI
jgi:hypothetical protein